MNMTRKGFMAAAGAFAFTSPVFATSKHVFRIGLVGCGGRGLGSLRDANRAVAYLGCELKLVSVCDLLPEATKAAVDKYGTAETKVFLGANGYKDVIASDCDIVFLCTPPIFRPLHMKACCAAGKHVFAEKPIATDPRGIREFLACAAEMKKKGLSLQSGLVMRYEPANLEIAGPILRGEIGKIVSGRFYRCCDTSWVRPRNPGESNRDYLCRNWIHFREMGGDQIVEQAIHHADVINWFIGRYPVSAYGMGARLRRPAGIGNVYDCQAIDYDYGEGVHVFGMGRQIKGCDVEIGCHLMGTEGAFDWVKGDLFVKRFDGRVVKPDPVEGRDQYGMTMEHVVNFRAILEGKPLAAGEVAAMSTASTLIGSMSAYTGKLVKMSDVLTDTTSPFYDGWNNKILPEMFEGKDDVPMPGVEGVAPIPGVA